MEALQIMPVMAQRRNSNLGEFAEDATVVVEEITKPRKVNHFIEANSVEVSLEHLKNDCVIPVFSKDNELTISHNAFIETVWEAASSFYSGERIKETDKATRHKVQPCDKRETSRSHQQAQEPADGSRHDPVL